MTGETILRITGTECPPELEQEFNNWYDNKQLPFMMTAPGIKKITRYKLIEGNDEKYPMYMTTYEWESQEAFVSWRNTPEWAAAHKDFEDYFEPNGVKVKWLVVYEPMRTWGK
ncbi:antibiotic biosynthesis monooxygenase family protein [Chloroflexota bacterium]